MSNQIDKMAWSDLVRNFFAPRPRDVDGVANQSSLYYREWCLKKLFGAYEIEDLPETWEIDYVLEHLFVDGYICVTDTDLGVLPLQTGYSGINIAMLVHRSISDAHILHFLYDRLSQDQLFLGRRAILAGLVRLGIEGHISQKPLCNCFHKKPP